MGSLGQLLADFQWETCTQLGYTSYGGRMLNVICFCTVVEATEQATQSSGRSCCAVLWHRYMSCRATLICGPCICDVCSPSDTPGCAHCGLCHTWLVHPAVLLLLLLRCSMPCCLPFSCCSSSSLPDISLRVALRTMRLERGGVVLRYHRGAQPSTGIQGLRGQTYTCRR